jgi:Zn-dependent protease with chaperone function
MFAKPLNLIIVYILTLINFAILLAPFATIVVLLVKLDQQFILNKLGEINFSIILSTLIFIVSFLMIFYLFLDFLFGFSLRSSLKDCKRYESSKEFNYLTPIFEQVKEQFGRRDVRLYISSSGEINAFAVGSLGKKIIVLTQGIISHAMNNSKDKREFLIILRSIMGHEMSHLVNKDYLPALIMITNQKATNFVSFLLEWTIRLPLLILGYVRVRSRILSDIVMLVYSLINKIVTFFNNHVVYNLYEFLRKFISRSVEYRCDKQSARAFGGYNMGLALSLFGENGYFTLFSTHPNTKSRIDRVANVARKKGVIRPLISSSISNYFSFIVLIIAASAAAKNSGIDVLVRYYLIDNNDVLYQKILYVYEWFKYIVAYVREHFIK